MTISITIRLKEGITMTNVNGDKWWKTDGFLWMKSRLISASSGIPFTNGLVKEICLGTRSVGFGSSINRKSTSGWGTAEPMTKRSDNRKWLYYYNKGQGNVGDALAEGIQLNAHISIWGTWNRTKFDSYMTLLIYSDFENQNTVCCVMFKYYTQYIVPIFLRR